MYRWIICPVVTFNRFDPETGTTELIRMPKAATLIEPGRGKYYQHSSAIDIGAWCLSLVKATDWIPLDADPECISILESDFADLGHINLTPRQLGFNAARLTRIRSRLSARGVDTTGLTLDSTLEEILDRLCTAVASWFRARTVRIT